MNYKIKNWLSKISLKFFVYLNKDCNCIAHCKNEVPDWFLEEGPNRWIADGTVELLAVLSHQGHSGSSISFALQFLNTMAMYKPWGPLTGEPSEWKECNLGDGTYQNKRCSKIFKRPDGTSYRIDGKVFHDGNNCYYTNKNSFVEVTFPYTITDPIVIDTTKE